ncbi:hypothetical protein B0A50_04396 [Salinomyces thailandicus]|uniref:Uncharacterized protein n=1 Tax=Salinomyces thailandicus TaxID=706561 RepID=A0A4U0U0H6_9PEZI|nr:hypothetical protein B0A50_04396 [Salinomyces thailandica]
MFWVSFSWSVSAEYRQYVLRHRDRHAEGILGPRSVAISTPPTPIAPLDSAAAHTDKPISSHNHQTKPESGLVRVLDTDTSYDALSPQAQKIQRKAREDFEARHARKAVVKRQRRAREDFSARRERTADDESLRHLEAATTRSKTAARTHRARERAADAQSLRWLEAASTGLPFTNKHDRREPRLLTNPPGGSQPGQHLLVTSSACSLITTPSSTALRRHHGPARLKTSAPPIKAPTSSPHTPQSRVGYYLQCKNHPPTPNPRSTDTTLESQVPAHIEGPAPSPKPTPSHGAEPNPGITNRTNKYDYRTDPFGWELIESSAEKSTRLEYSQKWYSRQDVQAVYHLFDALAGEEEEEEEDTEECENAASSVSASGGSRALREGAGFGNDIAVTAVSTGSRGESGVGLLAASPCLRLSLLSTRTGEDGLGEK